MRFQKFSKTQRCPTCQSTEVYRVKRVGLAIRVVCSVSNYRPYWCSNCDSFFFAPRRARAVRIEEHYPITKPEEPASKQPEAGGLTH